MCREIRVAATEIIELKQIIGVSEIIKKVCNVLRGKMMNTIVLVRVVDFVLPRYSRLENRYKYLRLRVLRRKQRRKSLPAIFIK